MIVTFYSYKGGVGRSMALANVAVSLAKANYKVLVLDWDLEAPGLSKFFKIDIKKRKGIIDLFYEYKDVASSNDPAYIEKHFPKIEGYAVNIKSHKNIRIVGPGLDDSNYDRRVNEFDWLDFYQNWEGGAFIASLRSELKKMADFVLIDSRTGITDIGGVCTLHLPDLVVLMSGMNDQNLHGTTRVAKRIKLAGESGEVSRKIHLLPVLSRIETSLDPKVWDEWFTRSVKLLREFLPESVGSPNYYFRESKINYNPALAFGERIITDESTTGTNDIAIAYEFLSSRLIELGGKAEDSTTQPSLHEIVLSFGRVSSNLPLDAPIPTRLHFGETETETFDFVNPLTDKDMGEIRWYLESYWIWPSETDNDRARIVEGNLSKWGKALFDAVFMKSSVEYRLFVRFDHDNTIGRWLTIDTVEPRILRLPWELLNDGNGYLLSKNPSVSILRRMHRSRQTKISKFEPPVRILMVTSRPEGAGFIDSRSIAGPLLDALDGISEQVDVEFLRPPTLRSLAERLRDKNRPSIHILHFDGHGVYDKGVGLGFLLFEDEKHQRHQVDAEQLGSILNESHVSLVVLGAAQSAQPDDRNPLGSIASRLIESGVGGVVAMNYSVLPETAKRFTSEFYGALARGLSTSAAMDSARQHLFADTQRLSFTRPNQEEAETLHLQDWFLPVLYQQVDELTPFASLSPGHKRARGEREAPLAQHHIPHQPERGGFPPSPLHGFHGRARELLDIERAFATRNIVVLHGFGGQGKTSLATQAAEWFTRTRLFDRAAFISFETGASLDFILNELGNALVEENFQIHAGDKVEAIAQSLKEKPALVVFDNFESALPGGNAPMPDLQALLDAAAKWFGVDGRPQTVDRPLSTVHGRSRLLITTRNTSIPHPAFTPGTNCIHKELSGLAPSDALELAASILEAYSLPRPPRLPLEELLAFLKGHPLSLQLALPQLRDYSAGQLVEQYQSILPHMKKGEAKERNESLEVSLRFSLDRLGADALNWLSRLWIFEGGAIETVLLSVTEIPEIEWNALKPQLTATALIRLEEIPGVTVPFVHFHPTLAPYLKALIDNDSQESSDSIENRYWQVYYQFANYLYDADTQSPLQARAIVLRELPNLKRALQRTLAAGALDEAVDFATRINRFLDNFGRWRERDEVAALVEKYTSTQGNTDGKITQREYLQESGHGERLLQQGRAGDAEKVFRALLARLEGNADYDTHYDQTLVLGYLGRCLSAQGRPSQAAEFYRRAIVLAEKLEQTDSNKLQASKFHTDLADVLAVSGQYAEARAEYELGLKSIREIDDNRSEGVILGQLGTLALRQGDLNEARKRYLEALGLFRRMGEKQSEAIVLQQLGRVAQEAHDWGEAEKFYKEAVVIREKIQDIPSLATNYNQLAIVAESAGRPQEAERWYLQTLEYAESLPDQGASVYHNLAGLLFSQEKLIEAKDYARRAVDLVEKQNISTEVWKMYSLLADIDEKCGRTDEARALRRKEQESFAAFAGSDNEIKQHDGLIQASVLAAQGNEEAKAFLEGEFPKMQAGGGVWIKVAQAIQSILAGERDVNVLTDGIDRERALIIRRILQVLNGEGADPHPPAPSPQGGEGGQAQEGGVTLPQLLELVERAAKGDKELGGQLFTAFQQMARADDPAMSALGNVLLRVLVGDTNPDLAGLPDEVASAIRGMLGRLKNK